MNKCLAVGAAFVIALSLAGVAKATSLTIQDQTPTGNDPRVRDANLRSDGWADGNLGPSWGSGMRQHPDVGWPDGKGPRHTIIGFDVSSLNPAWTINSATFGVYFQRSGGPAITNFKLSRLQAGKDWIEGTSGASPALTGEVTWNSQKHGQVLWEVVGATGASDVDMATTISWNKQASVSEWVTFDVKSWVQAWVNTSYQNNGMLIWGGQGPGGTAYWMPIMSEDTAVPARRPYLTIDYTIPEPMSALLLAAGSALRRRRRRA